MPAPADLPVVVAARLSLSFPFLISAVPFYAIDFTLPTARSFSVSGTSRYLAASGPTHPSRSLAAADPTGTRRRYSCGASGVACTGISHRMSASREDDPAGLRAA